jgi:hypothetical protein
VESFGGVRTSVAVTVLAVLALSGCSSGKKSTPTTSTSSTATTVVDTSTSAATTTSVTTAPSTAPGTTASTAAPPTTKQVGVRFTDFTILPGTSILCGPPTEIELKWTAVGAISVDLALDGRQFASFRDGPQDHLEYYACDGHPHTYRLTAHGAAGATATVSKVVTFTTPPG